MYRTIRRCFAGLASVAVVALVAGPASAAPAPAAADGTTVIQMPAPKAPPEPTKRTAAYFANCPQWAAYCSYDSGWEYYGAGSCQARTELGWWRASNYVSVRVHVYSPYLFAGCWVNSTPLFGTVFGTASGKRFYGMACSVWDPFCSEYQVRTYYEDSGLHPVFPPYVNAISVQHTPGSRP